MSEADQRRYWHFNPEISLGHLITTFSIIVAGLVWGLRLEGRVDADRALNEVYRDNVRLQFEAANERINGANKEIDRNRGERQTALNGIGQALKEINDSIKSIEVKMEGKADRK